MPWSYPGYAMRKAMVHVSEVRAFAREGMTQTKIAERYGVSKQRINQIIKDNGIGETTHREKQAACDAAIAAYEAGTSLKQCAQAFGVRYSYLCIRLTERGIPKRPWPKADLSALIERVRNGESIRSVCNGGHTLQVRLGRECHAAGVTSQAHGGRPRST
jgi:hypothetical protein